MTNLEIVQNIRRLDESRVYLGSLPVHDYALHNQTIRILSRAIKELESQYFEQTGNFISAIDIRDIETSEEETARKIKELD